LLSEADLAKDEDAESYDEQDSQRRRHADASEKSMIIPERPMWCI
jgi:hypothetical protein